MLWKIRSHGRFSRWLLLYAVFVTICVVFLYLGMMYCFTSSSSSTYNVNNFESKGKVNDEWWYFKMFAKTKLSPSKAKMSAFLVILILSTPRNMERRVTIRQTWLKDVKSNVLHLFAIGSTFLEMEEKRTLESEINHFSDILFLPQVNESYATLSDKLLQSLKWIQSNVNFDFLLKCDDDSFVRVDDIVFELESLSNKERLYWGFFDGRARVKRSGKWAEKDWVLCDHYLPYALGGGYVLSSDLVRFIAVNSGYLKLYRSEDISVGSWLAPVDLRRVHDSRFDTEFVSRGCFDSYLITHKQSVDQIKEKYWLLQEKDVICVSEHRTRLSYEYNWNVPPSRCCVRNDSNVP